MQAQKVTEPVHAAGRAPRRAALKHGLSPQNISAIYILVVMIVIFSIWVPDLFPTLDTVSQVLNNNALAALAALALVIPLSCGLFDVSLPQTMTLSGVVVTYTIANTDVPVWGALILAVAVSAAVGVVNAFVVVTMGIESLIGTLGTGFLIQAAVDWRTGSRTITSAELSQELPPVARQTWLFDLALPVLYVIVLALLIWVLMDQTATGRRLYATGFNAEAARLSGIRTKRLRFGSMIASSTIAGFAGVVLAGSLGSGSPTAGGHYLLPAFAGCFLGATQFKRGRFNAWGTLLAVVLLGTGTTGLALALQPEWLQNTFTGVVLIGALALTGFERRQVRCATSHVDEGDQDPLTPSVIPDAPPADHRQATKKRENA
jgi:ribose transport system permease protein